MLEKLPSPEELVAEVVIIGGLMNVKLTWWYDEDILDLVRISKLKLEFEIRQQCIGVKGRARVRSFKTAVQLEEESPQLYEVVGLSMKPYIFSVRCKSAECTSEYSVSLLVSPDGPPGVVDQSCDTSPSLLASPHWQHRPPEDSASRAALLLALRTHYQMGSVGEKTPPSQNTQDLTGTPTESASVSEFQQEAPSFRLGEPNALSQTKSPEESAQTMHSASRTLTGTPTPLSTPQVSDAPVHETKEALETHLPASAACGANIFSATCVSAVEEQTITSEEATLVSGNFQSCNDQDTHFHMGDNMAVDAPLKYYIGDDSPPPRAPSDAPPSRINIVNEEAPQQHAKINDEKSSPYQAVGDEEVASALERQTDEDFSAKFSHSGEAALLEQKSSAVTTSANHQPAPCLVDAVPNVSAKTPRGEKEDHAGSTCFSPLNNNSKEKQAKSPNHSKRDAEESLMIPWLDKILSEKTELMPRAKTFDVSRLNVGLPSLDSFSHMSPRRTPPTSKSFRTANVPKSSAPSSRSFTTPKAEVYSRNRLEWRLDSRLQAMNMAAQHMKKAVRPSVEPVSEEELNSRLPSCDTHSETLHHHNAVAERTPSTTMLQAQQNSPVLRSSPVLPTREDPQRMRLEAEKREVKEETEKRLAEKTVNTQCATTVPQNTTQQVSVTPAHPRRHSLQSTLWKMAPQQQEFNASCVSGGAPPLPRQLNTTISLPRGALQPHRPTHSAFTPKSAYAHVMSPKGNSLNHTRGIRGLFQRPPPSTVNRNAATSNASFEFRPFVDNPATRPPLPQQFANPFSSMPSSMFATPVAPSVPQGPPPTASLYPIASSSSVQFGNQLTSTQDRPFVSATNGHAPSSGDSFPFYCAPPQSVPQYPLASTEGHSTAGALQPAPFRSYAPPRRDSGDHFKKLPPPTKRTAPAFEREPEKTDRYQISIQVSDSQWETLQWSLPLDADKTLSQICLTFLKERGLKDAFHSGLVQKMNQLPSSGQVSAMVDIVDLI